MIDLASVRFARIALAVFLVVRVFGLPARWRPALYALATLAVFPSEGRPMLAALLGVALYGWLALRWCRSGLAMTLHVLLLSALFAASQHGAALHESLPLTASLLPLLGMPYVYLRLWHLLHEVRAGRLQPPGAVAYTAYLLPFHQLVAGPVQRFADFRRAMDAELPPLDPATVLAALSRIADGLLKRLVLCELIRRFTGFSFETDGWLLWLEVDLFFAHLYLDFSGYMDLAIGVGMLVGWTPPENFRWPFLSRNVVEFWTRWHITLGDWIRDHLFTPLNLTLQRGALRGRPLTAGAVCFLLSMGFCGLWHRSDGQFLVWGLLHGVAIALCKVFEARLKRRLGRQRFKDYMASRTAAALSGLVTFQFVALSLLFAFRPLDEALTILAELFT